MMRHRGSAGSKRCGRSYQHDFQSHAFPSLLLLIGLDLKTAPQAAATDPAPLLPVSSSILRPPSHGRALRLVLTTSVKTPRIRPLPPLHATGPARPPQAGTLGPHR